VTVYDPAGVDVVVATVRVDVAAPPGWISIFETERDAERPAAEGVIETIMWTVPLNPELLTVTIEVALPPAWTTDGDAAVETTVKSAETPSVMGEERTIEPLVKVTVKVYEPAGVDESVEMLSAEVAREPGTRLTLCGVALATSPGIDCDVEAETTTLPVNPRLSRVIEELAEPPAMKLDGTGDETVGLKSPATVIVRVNECAIDPLFPVSVTEYAPDGVVVPVEKLNVETPDPPAERATGFTVNETEAPAADVGIAADSVTEPVSPMLFRETVDVIELPATNGAGFVEGTEIVKSDCTVTNTLTL
jgi:hypothetical protein